MTTGTTKSLYADVEEFVELLRAAHPYLGQSDRVALIQLAVLWANQTLASKAVISDGRQ
jgi:hypothetical protein